jgi:hypothetical protein
VDIEVNDYRILCKKEAELAEMKFISKSKNEIICGCRGRRVEA